VKLSEEDLKVATDLWENTINPACIAFEKHTKKPAEAMREAIAGVIARRVNQPSTWNSWQKIWWTRLGRIHDKELRSKCPVSHDFPLNQIYLQGNPALNACESINPKSITLILKNP
jgi:hypothetical protein